MAQTEDERQSREPELKKIEAIIDAGCLERVCVVLLHYGVVDLTVTQCAAAGTGSRVVRSYRTAAWVPDHQQKCRIEVVVPNSNVAPVVKLIARTKRQNAHDDEGFRVTTIERVIPLADD